MVLDPAYCFDLHVSGDTAGAIESMRQVDVGAFRLYFNLGDRRWRVPHDEETAEAASRRAARLARASRAGGWVAVHRTIDGTEIGRALPGGEWASRGA